MSRRRKRADGVNRRFGVFCTVGMSNPAPFYTPAECFAPDDCKTLRRVPPPRGVLHQGTVEPWGLFHRRGVLQDAGYAVRRCVSPWQCLHSVGWENVVGALSADGVGV
jgi:hypothetical protein